LFYAGLIQNHTVPALALGAIERHVGSSQQEVGGLAILRINRNPDRNAEFANQVSSYGYVKDGDVSNEIKP
jgi:hypothetical protein